MVINISKLSYNYNGTKVLQNISFDIKKEDFVAIIGPNGAGKTTLIKLILGELKQKKGIIKLFGKKISEFKEWTSLGYVPQRFALDKLFPGTVKEILSIGLKEIPSKLISKNMLNKKFTELSMGQQQKVLIAFALQSNPKLLILDEPTSGVDVNSQKEFYELLKELNKKNKITIILVTHDVGMIPIHAKNVICINKTICCQGPVSETEVLLKKVYGKDFALHSHK